MIDLETLGTGARSIVLTIGAIKFSPFDDITPAKQGKELVGIDWFYRRVEMASCQELGLTADKSTVQWWMEQAADVRAEAFAEDNRHPIKQVMDDFRAWFGTAKHPWSHGKEFDITILSEIWRLMGQDTPWKFWDTLDTRTAYALMGVKPPKIKLAHHALWDCWKQVVAVQEAYRKVRGNNALALASPAA